MDHDAKEELFEWMAREILPHEADLRRWLRRRLPPEDVEDMVQELYCRLSRLDDASHIHNGRTYLFAAAKRLLLDHIRRSRIVRIETVAEIDALGFASDQPSPERVVSGRMELERIRAAIAALPERCATILEMRKIQGLPQRDVAAVLGLAEHIVENEVARGLRLIMKEIGNRGRERTSSIVGTEYERTRQR